MADLTDTNQNPEFTYGLNNPDTPETYKTMSANISKFGTVSTMFKVGGKFAPVFTGAQVVFEMIAEGPVKGFFTGAASVGGGAFGMGWGAVEGAKETWSTFRRTNNPINLINPLPTIMNMWKYSNKYSDIANIRTSIGYDLIGDSFKNLFQRNNSQGMLTGPAAGLTQAISGKVLNKDLSSNLKGTSLAGQALNIADPKLSVENAYTHPEVNTDVTQRVLSKNGAPASPTKLDGGVSKPDLAAASDPASLNKGFKTPNMQSISKVLYSGIRLGVGMLQGYLMSRMDQLLFGKEGAKTVGKVREGYSYYSMAKGMYENWGVIKAGAKAAWSAIKVGAQAAWHAVSSFVVQAVSWIGSAISSAVSAIAGAAAAVAGAIAGAVATAAAAVGGAIMSAIAWIAALAFPW